MNLRSWLIRREAPASDSGVLAQVIADLKDLNRNTEQDFLRIGGKLAEFIAAVDLISYGLTSLADVISGEHGAQALEALTRALRRSTEMSARAEKGNSLLGKIRLEAGRLSKTLAGFHGTVSTFHTLGVLTRIETARLGAAGGDFGNLAEEVKLLADSVQSRIEGALDTAALLIPPIESVMRRISALEEGQVRDLPAVISGVQASLASVREAQVRSHDSSIRLRAEYERISEACKELVVSLQFHDITRQQVEHVIEALGRIPSLDQPDLANVLTLQSSQMAGASETFASSTASVSRSLEEMATQVGKMSEECSALTGISASEKNSFIIQMEQGCAAILATLSRCAANDADTRVTSESLRQTIRQLRGSVDEIREIEIHMQRMALNGSIRAAHIGAPGDSLGILAGSIQQLALDSNQLSESLIETLNSMGGAAAGLLEQDCPEAEQDCCLEAMRKAVAALHSSREQSAAKIDEIITRGVRLREDISATRQSFSVGDLFAEAIRRAREALAELGEKHRSATPADGSELLHGLADFAQHYTMQAEHDVHQSVTMAISAAAPAVAQMESEGLGENVELF